MDAVTINPFIESINDLFERMLDCKVVLGRPSRADFSIVSSDITGIIGLSGSVLGIVALRFPEKTACAVVGRMVGTEINTVDPSIIDGIGELVNIAAGGAKGKLEGHSIFVSLPTVTRGGIYRLRNMRDTVWMDVPFESELGEFSMIVTLKQSAEKKAEVVNESVSG